MSSSILRNNLPENRKERRYEIGEQGEINVGTILSDFFGYRKVSYGFDGYSEGTNYYPDLVLKINPVLAIEVKSMGTYVIRNLKNKKKIRYSNYVTVNKKQWYGERCFANSRKAKLILIIEVRLKDRGIYFWFNEDMLLEYFEKSDAENIFINIHDVWNKGNPLIYDKDFKYLEYWNVNTLLDKDIQEIL